MTRMDYFGGFEGENKYRNNSLNILGITVKKYLWDCKHFKKLLTIEESRAYTKKNIKNWYDCASKFSEMWERSGLRIRF